eukprot:TRINITY_DN62947_c0_g1_i1.p1 TRINITY_DN62947_c0_g1~~TRINITY_DN62947_c0_g1_i1.p1  ORF type:complete len:1016 (+),score=222.09 TRINITY_DN62947_c0_g1_i1:89-3136(+)
MESCGLVCQKTLTSTSSTRMRCRRQEVRRQRPWPTLLSFCLLGVLCWSARTLEPFCFGLLSPVRKPGLHAAALRSRVLGRSASVAVGASAKQSTAIPTAQAPFLSAQQQPLLLSPDGVRTASFELSESGMMIRVEAAPAFGDEAAATVATAQDIVDRVTIIPKAKLGLTGVQDLFWLSDRCFLITGYESGEEVAGRFYGWIADLKNGKASVISMPSKDASLFVPTSPSGAPMLRFDEQGSPEVLLGFLLPEAEDADDEEEGLAWGWYGTGSGDLVEASEDEQLPSSLWREAVVSKLGIIEAVLLVNGTVCRRTPEGWRDIGSIKLATESLATVRESMAKRPFQPRKYLVAAGDDYSVVAVDTIGPDSPAPLKFPTREELGEDLSVAVPASEEEDLSALLLGSQKQEDLASLVLRQCQERETAALVRMTADGAPPTPLFVHPFADVTAAGVWTDPDSESVQAVTVTDLRPKAYSLETNHRELLNSLQQSLPSVVTLGEHSLPSQAMEPLWLQRHGERCIVRYWHPLMTDAVVLPALMKSEAASWLGSNALPASGGALNAVATTLSPKVEGHRLQVASRDVPVYLVLPPDDAGALVVRLHEGQGRRDVWGSDGVDAWLLSRGYGILKVNHRGSSGFGRSWQAAGDASSTSDAVDMDAIVEDVDAAIRWALSERKVLGDVFSSEGAKAPVAVMGRYFGGYVALHVATRLQELITCTAAIAPLQDWEVVKPAPETQKLCQLPVMVVEFEQDSPEARGHLLESLAHSGCDPQDWPTSISYVQYAGEGRGGGKVRQSMLDLHRRLDSFLYEHLSPLAGKGKLSCEPFFDEIPFLSASLQPAARSGSLSGSGKEFEQGFEGLFLSSRGEEAAGRLPELRTAAGTPSGAGFSGQTSQKTGKRKALVAPANRLAVRADGTMEITLAFAEPPEGLHVLLTEVMLHIRAKGLGFTLTLPRQPKKGEEIQPFKLADGTGFVFEISGEPHIGAIDNFNGFATSGGRLSLLSVLTPEDLDSAPVIVPAA